MDILDDDSVCASCDDEDDAFDYGNGLQDLTEEEVNCMFDLDPAKWENVSPTKNFKLSSSEGRSTFWDAALNELSSVRGNMYKCCGRDRIAIDGVYGVCVLHSTGGS